MTSHAVNDTTRMRLTKAMLSSGLAGWYPYASRERIEKLTSFQAWFHHRRYPRPVLSRAPICTCGLPALHVLLADCRDFVERGLGVLSVPATAAPEQYQDHDAVKSFQEYAEAVCHSYRNNLTYRARIAKEAIATLDSYRQEALNRHAGRVPSLDEYLGYRKASSCMMQVVVNFEFANGISLPEEVMTCEEMRKWFRTAVAVTYIVNDIVSFRKEIREGFVENLVVLLANGKVQKGLDTAVAKLEREVAAVNEAFEAAAQRFAGTPHQDDVCHLGKKLQEHVYGQLALEVTKHCLFDEPSKLSRLKTVSRHLDIAYETSSRMQMEDTASPSTPSLNFNKLTLPDFGLAVEHGELHTENKHSVA